LPIPPLDEHGFLPAGLHLASLEQIEAQFGVITEVRRDLYRRLAEYVDLARHVGAHRIFIGGSFVSSKPEPGDVDIVIWVGGNFTGLLDALDEKALDLELRFLTRTPQEAFAAFDEEGWLDWVEFFSLVRGRRDLRKGLLEVKLR